MAAKTADNVLTVLSSSGSSGRRNRLNVAVVLAVGDDYRSTPTGKKRGLAGIVRGETRLEVTDNGMVALRCQVR